MKMTKRFSALLLAFHFAAIATIAGDWVVYEGKKGPGKGKHIVFLSGDEEYRSEEGLPQLAKILAVQHGFKCTVLFSINKAGEIEVIRLQEREEQVLRNMLNLKAVIKALV